MAAMAMAWAWPWAPWAIARSESIRTLETQEGSRAGRNSGDSLEICS